MIGTSALAALSSLLCRQAKRTIVNHGVMV